MRLSTSTNILFERQNQAPINPSETMVICKNAGFEVLDFCFHDLSTYQNDFLTDSWQDYFKKCKEKADEIGVEFSQGHAVVYDFCRKDISHPHFEQLLTKCIIGASEIGVKWLVLHPSTVHSNRPYLDSKKENVEFFKRWVDFAAKYQVGLAIENMWDAHISPIKLYCTTAEELVDLVEDVPGLEICWDQEHSSIMNQDILSSLRLIGSHLKATHISDYTNPRDIHLLPFMVKINLSEIMNAFKKVNYQGDFDLEIHRYLTKMPLENCEQAIRLSYEIGSTLLKMVK